jgi:hypothetical protein
VEKSVHRFTVEERIDAWGMRLWAVLELGEFEEYNWESRLRKRSKRVVFVTPDARDAYQEAGLRNLAIEVA